MADASQQPHEPENHRNLDALSASEAPGVVDAIERNRTKILGGIAVGAILLCGVLVVAQMKKQKHLASSQAYTAAASKGDIAALDAVLVEFPGSIGAGNALLKKADIQIDQGKSEDARTTLERFSAEFVSHPRYAQGIFALANLFHVAGDREMAKSHYEKVISVQKDGELTPLARIRLGDLALEAGDAKSADQFYQESYTLHPGNPFFEYAEEKIALLKVGNPPEVAKPTPPAPPLEPSATATTKDPAKPATVPTLPQPLKEAASKEQPKAATPPVVPPKAETPKPEAPKTEAAKPGSVPPTAPSAPAPKAQTTKPESREAAASSPTPAPAVPKTPEAPQPAASTPEQAK